jgi:AcrR family transcriptional regulator
VSTAPEPRALPLAHRSPTGRRPGRSATTTDILRTARFEFAAHGYEGTAMRIIAQKAGVDAALIHHFFLTKEGLFLNVVKGAFSPPQLATRGLRGPREQAGTELARAYITHWEDPEVRPRMLAVMRSLTALDSAAAIIRNCVDEVLFPAVRSLEVDRPRIRAALVGSHLIGMALTRYILEAEPLSSLSQDEVITYLGDACAPFLFEPLGPVHVG